jgi:hypothetical protein
LDIGGRSPLIPEEEIGGGGAEKNCVIIAPWFRPILVSHQQAPVSVRAAPSGRAYLPCYVCTHWMEVRLNMDETTLLRTLGLFVITAVAELIGCYLPLLWLAGKGSAWLLFPQH